MNLPRGCTLDDINREWGDAPDEQDDTMRLARIERTIAEAIDGALSRGWTLVSAGEYGDAKTRTCDALGALAVMLCDDPEPGGRHPSYRLLEVTEREHNAIGEGWDGQADDGRAPDMYAIGARLRGRYLATGGGAL